MIKRQYDRFKPGYFYNFVNNQVDLEAHIEDGLRPYKATIGKSKYKNNNKLNVKWHDARLYTLFVMRWA